MIATIAFNPWERQMSSEGSADFHFYRFLLWEGSEFPLNIFFDIVTETEPTEPNRLVCEPIETEPNL